MSGRAFPSGDASAAWDERADAARIAAAAKPDIEVFITTSS
jgi:hypothetical protein